MIGKVAGPSREWSFHRSTPPRSCMSDPVTTPLRFRPVSPRCRSCPLCSVSVLAGPPRAGRRHAVLVLRWFLDGTRLARLAADDQLLGGVLPGTSTASGGRRFRLRRDQVAYSQTTTLRLTGTDSVSEANSSGERVRIRSMSSKTARRCVRMVSRARGRSPSRTAWKISTCWSANVAGWGLLESEAARPVEVALGRHDGRPRPRVAAQLQQAVVERLVEAEELLQVDAGRLLPVEVRRAARPRRPGRARPACRPARRARRPRAGTARRRRGPGRRGRRTTRPAGRPEPGPPRRAGSGSPGPGSGSHRALRPARSPTAPHPGAAPGSAPCAAASRTRRGGWCAGSGGAAMLIQPSTTSSEELVHQHLTHCSTGACIPVLLHQQSCQSREP